MSDFLGQLASRALAPEKTLKPRLLSAFEPANSALGPMLAALDAGEPPEHRPAEAVDAVARSRSVKRVSASFAEGSTDSKSDQHLRPITRDRAQPTPARESSVPNAPSEAIGQPLSTTPLAAAPGQELAGSFRPRPARPPAAHSGPDAPPAPSAAVPRPETDPTLPLVSKASPARQAEDGGQEKHRQPTLPSLHPILAGLRPKLTTPAAPVEPRHQPEAPSTIHVTIGRLEVRAVAPAVPMPLARRARPEPALGLKEYLERRKGSRTR